jgi:hypothetical protein
MALSSTSFGSMKTDGQSINEAGVNINEKIHARIAGHLSIDWCSDRRVNKEKPPSSWHVVDSAGRVIADEYVVMM